MKRIKDTSLPYVSTIIVTRNESLYIEKSLKSLLMQTYPINKYEVIIVDGESDDNTIGKATDCIKDIRKQGIAIPKVLFRTNTKKILSSGWNIGIKEAKGDYVVRIDAHSEVADDFLEKSVETIMSVNAICVGGKLITVTLDEKGAMVRDILSSPFGIGNSNFRVSNTAGFSDTAVYGLYKKSVFDNVGYFDEWLVRNQDIELHTRIKKMGGRFYFNPEIVCKYYSRSTLRKMLKQGFQNGKWNFITLRKNRTQLSLRHVVPLAFLLFIVGTTILGCFFKHIWFLEIALLILYFALALYAASRKSNNIGYILKMMGMFFLLHVTYGCGSLTGIFTKIQKG